MAAPLKKNAVSQETRTPTAAGPITNTKSQSDSQRALSIARTLGNNGVGNADALMRLSRATDSVKLQLEAIKGRRDVQDEINNDQWIVSSVSETVGSVVNVFKGKGLHSVEIPSVAIWIESDRLVMQARECIRNGDVLRAAHTVSELAEEYKRVAAIVNEYLENVIGGAEIATTGLEAAAAAGAVAATIATGGLAAGAGAGLLGTSAVVGVTAGVYGATQETANQGGQMIAGTRKEFDFGAIALRGGKDAVMGFVGTLVGGALSKYAVNYFGRFLMQRLKPDQIALVAEKLGVNAAELTPAAFVSKGQKFVVDFLAGVGSTPLTTAVDVVLQRLQGHKDPSPEEFAEMVMKSAVEGGILQLFLGALGHGRTPKVAKRVGVEPIPIEQSVGEMQLQTHAESTAELQSQVASPDTRTPIEVPEVTENMQLQSAVESTADLQAQTSLNTVEPTDVPQASDKIPMQSTGERAAELQKQIGSPQPKAAQPQISQEVGGKPVEFRKTKGPAKPSAKPRKAELEPTKIGTDREVASGELLKKGKAKQSSAAAREFTSRAQAEARGHKFRGTPKAPSRKTPTKSLTPDEKASGRERQLYDTYEWKERRAEADKLRRETANKLWNRLFKSTPKGGAEVGKPDPALPGQEVMAVHQDHIVPANRIRRMPGFALLDAATQNELLNLPENIEPISDLVNQSRGDMPYDQYTGNKQRSLTADPAWVQQMATKEKQLEAFFRSRIDELVKQRVNLDWRLRFGLPLDYKQKT